MKRNNILILIILFLTILLIIILMLLKAYSTINDASPENIVDIEVEYSIRKITNRSNYYIIKNCIDKFYIYYSTIQNSVKNGKTEEIYNMLDAEYIKYREITHDNILSKLRGVSSSKVNIIDMYVAEQSENISVYIVYGTLRNKKTNEISKYSIMIKTDKKNKTFSIFLEDYIEEKYSNIRIGENIQFNYLDEIEPNKNNTYSYEPITENAYIEDIMQLFKENILYDKQRAYESLDEEYRTKRFPNFADFEKYIKDNIRKIAAIKIAQYDKNVSEDVIQYICKDTNNNYYIINETSTMNCTFILDTYTIDLPEFLEKYENCDDREKVALNIEKIKEAINAKDFKYVYNKTDETFKKNNFKNYSNFENYLKSNLFEENTFEYKDIEQTANVYIATVIVKNKKNKNAVEKEIKIIMKLTDNTDYLISFSFE